MAYWLLGFIVVLGRAAGSRNVFGKALTLMSYETNWLGSFCWRGLAKAWESTRARKKIRENEIMTKSLAWERAKTWLAFEGWRDHNNDNIRHLEDRKGLAKCHGTHTHTLLKHTLEGRPAT